MQNITCLSWMNLKKLWSRNALGSLAEVSCSCKSMLPRTKHTHLCRKTRGRSFKLVDLSLYSLDLAPFDYYLFPTLGKKKHHRGTNYHSGAEVINATEGWLEAQNSEFFLQGLQKLKDRCYKSMNVRGELVEWKHNPSFLVHFLLPKGRSFSSPLRRG